jgi:hypothetical protein
MNKSKISASLLIIIAIVATLSFFVVVPKPIQQTELPSYIISNTVTTKNMVVWNTNNVTAVNGTETTWLIFTKLTYNQTSMIVTSQLIDQWRLNYATAKLYENSSTSESIQWAINNSEYYEGKIGFEGGTYNITAPIFLTSGINLDGAGTRFIPSQDFQGSVINALNCSRVTIQNLFIDMTNVNQTGVEVKQP